MTSSVRSGTLLGSYRVVGPLASGTMGSVYRAEHVRLGRPAAIKLLRRELTEDAAQVACLVREARAVAACKHPSVVEVYDVGRAPDGSDFLVMELLDGESLGRRLARGPIAEPEALAITSAIAGALRAAHKVGVIHRDLKPENVFLVADPDGPRAKVLDFGIAKLVGGARYTETGALVGTPMYMAPEQARGSGEIDARADLYALGCVLYHMLVGRPPFVAEGAGELIALHLFAEPTPPGRVAAVSPAVDQLVMALLAKDPAARPADAAAVIAAIAGVAAPAPPKRTWRVAVGAAALLASAAIAYGVVRATRSDAAPMPMPVMTTPAPPAPPDLAVRTIAPPPAVPAPAPAPRVRKAVEVRRKPVVAPTTPHTLDGSPMELDVDLRKPAKGPQ